VASAGAASGSASGTLEQAASAPTINATTARAPDAPRNRFMLLILLEALLALGLLLLIVWWTMFSGRRKGEPRRDDEP
jgi:hypothetical protein